MVVVVYPENRNHDNAVKPYISNKANKKTICLSLVCFPGMYVRTCHNGDGWFTGSARAHKHRGGQHVRRAAVLLLNLRVFRIC